jgi:hypothetical protein
MAIEIEIDNVNPVAVEISTSLYESFGGRVDFAAIAELVDRELARYAQAPVQVFVPLFVERSVRARLREDRAS